ncbi:MAG: galactokinase family protein [Chloroflexota bacterium]
MNVAVKPPILASRPEAERIDYLVQRMEQSYGVSVTDISIIRAPLRICPLGAHIDHQLGIVTGMTIDQSLLLAFAPTSDRTIQVRSSSFDHATDFELGQIPPYIVGDWGNYLRGAAAALLQEHELTRGLLGYVDGEMPIGGLSSSAAVTVAYLLALESVNNLTVTPSQNIDLVSRTEQDYIGLQNGILDQTSVLFSQQGFLTHIDCQDQTISQVASPDEKTPFEIMVVYSGVSKSLVGSSYNNRVAECQEAARLLLTYVSQSHDNPRLRNVAPAIFESEGHRLPDIPRRRANHYFGEMQRVSQGVAAWEQGNMTDFGQLMTESGESSVYQYESGCPQLITLYEILRETPGVLGNRFSGAGFRGNCIALIDPAAREPIAQTIHQHYPDAYPSESSSYSIHFCQPAGPATLLSNLSSV